MESRVLEKSGRPGPGNSAPSRPGVITGQLDDKRPKSAQVYELLRAAIIEMKLLPGAPIIEKEICSSLNISRTPLREAIIQLDSDGLIVVKPGGGTYVNLIDLKAVLNGQLTRDSLEARVVRLAARNYQPKFESRFEVLLFQQKGAVEREDMNEFHELDNGFHKLICECAGFANAWDTIHGATGQLDRIRRYALPNGDHFKESFHEHGQIFGLIKARDEDGALKAFHRHIDRLFKEVELIKRIDPDFVLNGGDFSIESIR
ncbi:MAG: GntR family transcriptional regulator [Maritimibacter sp.]|nr:GntR family transcriptional regulator [Maritimibacter sp.]